MGKKLEEVIRYQPYDSKSHYVTPNKSEIQSMKKVKTFHCFNPDKSKSPSKRKIGTSRCQTYGGLKFQFSKEIGLRGGEVDSEKDRMICSHVPYISERQYIHTDTEDRESTLSWGVYGAGAEEVRSGMPDIQSDKYLSNHLPHGVSVYSPKDFKFFLQSQANKVPLIELYNYTGFILNKFEYVHSGGVIATKKQNNVCSELPDGKTKTLIGYDKKNKNIIKALDNILELSPALPMLLTYELLSLTYSKYENKKPQFVLLLFGESGSFKTTVSLHIFGIFEEEYEDPPINLKNASLPSIHNISYQYKDTVVLADDGAPSPDGNSELCAKVESITRSYGDGTGRTVMKSVTSIHNTKPVGLSAVTAEFQPLRDTSDMARSVMYELKKGDINIDDLSAVQAQKSEYIRFITDYIGWICKQKEKYIKELNQLFYEGRKKYENLQQIHARIPENYGWLYAGFHMFLKFATEEYNISIEQKKKWYKIFESAVEKCVSVQKNEMKSINEAELFVSTVNKLAGTKQCEFAEICTGKNNKKTANLSVKTIGCFDDKYAYIFFDEAYNMTNKYLKHTGDGYSLPKNALKSRLVSKGKVIVSEKGRYDSKITLNGTRRQVLKFKRKNFAC